jgi:hypothetical protein
MKKIILTILITFASVTNVNSFEYNCHHPSFEKLRLILDTEEKNYKVSFKYSADVKKFHKQLEPYSPNKVDQGMIEEKGKILKIENNNLYYFSHVDNIFIFDLQKSIFYIDENNKSESVKAYEKSFGTEGVKQLVKESIRKCKKI